MTAFKKAILFLHRWLGFISGLVVFVVSITGCIYCFQDELQDALLPYRKVQVVAKPMLLPSQLRQIALHQYPKGKISLINYYTANRSAQVRITAQKKLHSLYINPYTGAVLYDDADFANNFFNQVKRIHLYCFFPPKTGKIVEGTSVIIFVILLITGIILWWPKRKTDRKRSFTIKWRGRWRRVNYDLHNVLGFYAFSITLLLAVSGLAISYDWVSDGIYFVANGGKNFPAEKKRFKSDILYHDTASGKIPVIDRAYQTVMKQSPGTQMLLCLPGAKASSPLSFIAYPRVLHFSYSDVYAFDKNSGRLLNYLPNNKKSAGLELNGMTYDIHVGQIGGLLGKIIAFMASLISASLPVTGLIVYLGKKTKKARIVKVGQRVKRVAL